ncbi:hypothetical protein DPMN_048514 [Dreissena polymorpha]|uniref:Uncharacterized protein n=1 Tax=Dreissena polymorpha TaxID=45954 RepID=A0A9D4I2Z3_DREPO|nr:hypothetical protein DPMN_048514 [Dreissena polymorpha]
MVIGQILKTAPPTGGHIGHEIFQLHRDIIGTNLLTKFHEDGTKKVASRVFTRKTAPPTGGHVFLFLDLVTYFKLDRYIIGTKLLTKFHEDRKRNVPSRKYTVLLYYENVNSQRGETARPPGNHVFQRTRTIFELNSHIKKTNVLTKFHENLAKNVTSRVFTCFHNIHMEKNAPPTGGHVFSPIWTIFKLVRVFKRTGTTLNSTKIS